MTRTTLLTTLSLALALPLGLTSPALANAPQCGQRDAIVAFLAERYGETPQAIGLAQNQVMEVYASLDSGTWTIAVTDPQGLMCLVAAGQGFEPVNVPLPAKGTRA